MQIGLFQGKIRRWAFLPATSKLIFGRTAYYELLLCLYGPVVLMNVNFIGFQNSAIKDLSFMWQPEKLGCVCMYKFLPERNWKLGEGWEKKVGKVFSGFPGL